MRVTHETVLDMKSNTFLEEGNIVSTLGYYSAGDGGNATYIIREKNESDEIDDSFICSINDESLVAELVIENNTIHAKKIGIVGDGNVGDIAKIQNAINKATERMTISIPEGTYKISEFYSHTSVSGKIGIAILRKNNIVIDFGKSIITLTEDFVNVGGAAAKLKWCENVTIKGGKFVGNYDEQVASNEEIVNIHGISVESYCKNIVLNGVESSNWSGGGICIGGNPKPEYITIDNCKAYHCRYHSAFAEGVDHLIVKNSLFENADGYNFSCSLDVEGRSLDVPNIDVLIEGCYFGSSTAASLNINKVKNAKVYNCIFENKNVVVQPADNTEIKHCIFNSCDIRINNYTKNLYVDNNRFENGGFSAGSLQANLENIIFSNNIVNINNTSSNKKIAFNLSVKGFSDIKIFNNTVKLASGNNVFMDITGTNSDNKESIAIKNNIFVMGTNGNPITKIGNILFAFRHIGVDFIKNTIKLLSSDDLETYKYDGTVLQNLCILQSQIDSYHTLKVLDNDIICDTSALSDLRIVKQYNALSPTGTKPLFVIQNNNIEVNGAGVTNSAFSILTGIKTIITANNLISDCMTSWLTGTDTYTTMSNNTINGMAE